MEFIAPFKSISFICEFQCGIELTRIKNSKKINQQLFIFN